MIISLKYSDKYIQKIIIIPFWIANGGLQNLLKFTRLYQETEFSIEVVYTAESHESDINTVMTVTVYFSFQIPENEQVKMKSCFARSLLFFAYPPYERNHVTLLLEKYSNFFGFKWVYRCWVPKKPKPNHVYYIMWSGKCMRNSQYWIIYILQTIHDCENERAFFANRKFVC